jgi:hypothetical protein
MAGLILLEIDNKGIATSTQIKNLDKLVYDSRRSCRGIRILRKTTEGTEEKLLFAQFPIENKEKPIDIYRLDNLEPVQYILESIARLMTLGNSSLSYRKIHHPTYGDGFEFLI